MERGFTLIELLVVMTISAILLAIAVPSFQSSIASMRATEAANSLLSSLELARSEAMRRGVNVTVCRVNDSTSATPTCSATAVGTYGAADWANGWMTFVDGPGGTRGTVDNVAEERLQVQQLYGGGARVAVNILPASPARTLEGVTYQPTGLRVQDSANTRFEVRYPDSGTIIQQRCVCVNPTGQVVVRRAACSANNNDPC